MMTVGDINNVTFEKAMRGYRSEDVDDFLAKVAQEFDALMAERDEVLQERDATAVAVQQEKEAREAAEKKLYILAEKIEQYRADEENLKITLLNAQRMGDTVINEAKQKAESIVYEAKTRAAQLHEEMKSQLFAEEKRLSSLRKDVGKFRADVLEMYQRHVDMVSTIPAHEEKKVVSAPVAPAVLVAPIVPVAFSAVEPEPIAPQKTHIAVPAAQVQIAQPPVAMTEEEAAPIAPMAKEQAPIVPMQMPEVEQPTFDTASAPSVTPIDSFENYQGISFDE